MPQLTVIVQCAPRLVTTNPTSAVGSRRTGWWLAGLGSVWPAAAPRQPSATCLQCCGECARPPAPRAFQAWGTLGCGGRQLLAPRAEPKLLPRLQSAGNGACPLLHLPLPAWRGSLPCKPTSAGPGWLASLLLGPLASGAPHLQVILYLLVSRTLTPHISHLPSCNRTPGPGK